MQFFWFFYTNKRTGVRGKALQIKKDKKLLFFFPPQKEPKSANALALYFGIYKIVFIFCYR